MQKKNQSIVFQKIKSEREREREIKCCYHQPDRACLLPSIDRRLFSIPLRPLPNFVLELLIRFVVQFVSSFYLYLSALPVLLLLRLLPDVLVGVADAGYGGGGGVGVSGDDDSVGFAFAEFATDCDDERCDDLLNVNNFATTRTTTMIPKLNREVVN